jgi:hypothetical protein
VLNSGGREKQRGLFKGENFHLIAVRAGHKLAVQPKLGTALGARSRVMTCRRAQTLRFLANSLDSVKTATTMTEHCNTQESLMALAAHRALSLQLFHMVFSFDLIWFDGDGDIRTLPTRAFVAPLPTIPHLMNG